MSRWSLAAHQQQLAAHAEWEWNLAQLAEFARAHGHCQLGNHPLGEWLRSQQQLGILGKLSAERHQRLVDLGVAFDAQDEAWNGSLQALRDHLMRQQVRRDSTRTVWLPEPLDGALAAWLREQRALHAEGLLGQERLRVLKGLKLIGTTPSIGNTPPIDSTLPEATNPSPIWDARLRELQEFYQQFGHCDVPKDWAAHPGLAAWVDYARGQNYRGRLSPHRFSQLDRMGFAWSIGRRDADDRWEKRFAELSSFQEQHGHTRVPKSQSYQLWHWRHVQREFRRKGILKPERTARLDAIGFEWEEKGKPFARSRDERWEMQWEEMFRQLVAYQAEHGSTHVVTGWKPNPKLAAWVGNQRENHSHGRLRQDRKRRLDDIGFAWNVENETLRQLWETRFAEMCTFKEQHGHTRVPKSHGYELWHWRHVQREFRRKGTLKPERVARLDAIGFEWADKGKPFAKSREERWEKQWEEMFRQLLAYQAEHGSTQVVAGWKPNPTLATWVGDQREHHRHGRMRPDRKQRLDDIGFAWNVDNETLRQLWETRFAELCAFKEQHGHTRVRESQNSQLSRWRLVQREFRRKGSLKPERIARLDAIGFDWEEPDDRFAKSREEPWENLWNELFSQLVAYRAEHGHTHVVKGWAPNPALAAWVLRQRDHQRRGSLHPDRKRRLDEIGFAWNVENETLRQLWETRFAELCAFKEQHGHTHVRESQNYPLSRWRLMQRELRREGTLKHERIDRLDAIGFDWEG